MRLWILGGEGLLGTALQKQCAQKGIAAVASSKEEADITDLDRLKRLSQEIQPTHLVNCAAYTNVDCAEEEKEKAFSINAGGAENIGILAQTAPIKVIHISTDYVFDGRKTSPYREQDPCYPVNVYGTSKHEGEVRLQEKCPEACVVRTSWLFGKKGKNFISSILSVLQQKEEVKVVADQCGKPTYCDDAADAILQLLDYQGLIHFANQGGLSRFEIAQEVQRVAQECGIPLVCRAIHPASSSQFPTPARRPVYSVLSTEKYEAHVQTTPRPWREALKEFLQHG